MAITEQIKIVVDLAADKATSSLKGFRQAIHDADGASGKLKAGWKATGDFVSSHAAAFAASAGTALVTFGVKSVAAFQETALAAKALADATGISTEAASRWNEVAGDIRASGEAVQKAILKMEKAVATTPAKFEELGVQLAYTDSGALDANETFIRLIEQLGKIQDPAVRAKAASDLMGKGFGDLAELMSTDVRAALDSVSNAKVIDAKEAANAVKLRDALDRLRGVAEDTGNTVGGMLAPAIADAADQLAVLGENLDKIEMPLQGFGKVAKLALDNLLPLDNATSGLSRTFDSNASAGERAYGALEAMTGIIPIVGEGTQALGERVFDITTKFDLEGSAAAIAGIKARQAGEDHEDAAGGVDEMASSLDVVTTAAKAVIDHAKDLEQQLDDLRTAVMAAADADIGYQRSLNATEDAFVDLYAAGLAATKAQGTDRPAALRAAEEAELATKDAMLAQADAAVRLWEDQLAANGATLSAKDAARLQAEELGKFAAVLDPNSSLAKWLQSYIDKLNAVPSSIDTSVTVNGKPVGVTPGGDFVAPVAVGGKRHSGGPVTKGVPYLVGRTGAEELFVPDQSGQILSNQVTSGLMTGTGVPTSGMGTINIYVSGSVLTERDLAVAIGEIWAQEQRRGARLPWSS